MLKVKNKELLEFMGEFVLNGEQKQNIIEAVADNLTYDKAIEMAMEMLYRIDSPEIPDYIGRSTFVARMMYLQGYHEAMQIYDTLIRQKILNNQN